MQNLDMFTDASNKVAIHTRTFESNIHLRNVANFKRFGTTLATVSFAESSPTNNAPCIPRITCIVFANPCQFSGMAVIEVQIEVAALKVTNPATTGGSKGQRLAIVHLQS
jgi:hypothetical protein